ncbi:hypothetical protein RJZ90_002995 [Blastomyces dermatitidis]
MPGNAGDHRATPPPTETHMPVSPARWRGTAAEGAAGPNNSEKPGRWVGSVRWEKTSHNCLLAREAAVRSSPASLCQAGQQATMEAENTAPARANDRTVQETGKDKLAQ